MKSTCLIFFEDPFWVGIFERTDEKGYSAARYVFGAEPTSAQLLEFALHQYQTLRFSTPQTNPPAAEKEIGFKRRQRKIRQQMDVEPGCTYAQSVLKAELEQNKQTRHKISHQEWTLQEKQRFEQKQSQKKEKHRGH